MIELPEIPEMKYDGACQICHGDHTKCKGQCMPEITLPLNKCDACTGHGGLSLMPNGKWEPDECPVCGSKPD